MTFLEYIGPEKALAYGLGAGFVLGIVFCLLVDYSSQRSQ